MYCSECTFIQSIGKEDERKLSAFEMFMWRRVKNISWTEKLINEELVERFGEK